ncbi:hypothetical protein MKZ38_004310 [Zalerion maritima]|uniref:Uncharacterized protein n=1 Tax=Zalerion maritima TaxID=339359 RepID=A0AAD5WR33_9PEZI|nr:hypothetical protein MKZ38_004310 [Zalerion maritima]
MSTSPIAARFQNAKKNKEKQEMEERIVLNQLDRLIHTSMQPLTPKHKVNIRKKLIQFVKDQCLESDKVELEDFDHWDGWFKSTFAGTFRSYSLPRDVMGLFRQQSVGLLNSKTSYFFQKSTADGMDPSQIRFGLRMIVGRPLAYTTSVRLYYWLGIPISLGAKKYWLIAGEQTVRNEGKYNKVEWFRYLLSFSLGGYQGERRSQQELGVWGSSPPKENAFICLSQLYMIEEDADGMVRGIATTGGLIYEDDDNDGKSVQSAQKLKNAFYALSTKHRDFWSVTTQYYHHAATCTSTTAAMATQRGNLNPYYAKVGEVVKTRPSPGSAAVNINNGNHLLSSPPNQETTVRTVKARLSSILHDLDTGDASMVTEYMPPLARSSPRLSHAVPYRRDYDTKEFFEYAHLPIWYAKWLGSGLIPLNLESNAGMQICDFVDKNFGIYE